MDRRTSFEDGAVLRCGSRTRVPDWVAEYAVRRLRQKLGGGLAPYAAKVRLPGVLRDFGSRE
jgi:hypothetical protein